MTAFFTLLALAMNSPPKHTSKTTSRLDKIQDLYKLYWQDLCNFLRARFGPPPEPEDIAQTAFIKLADYAEQNAIEHPKSLLFRTASNLVVDYHRSPKNVLATADDEKSFDRAENSDVLGPESVLMGKQEMAIVEQVIMSLPERDRAFVLMNRLEEMTYTEIAKKAGLSRAGVQKIVVKALKQCSDALKRARQD